MAYILTGLLQTHFVTKKQGHESAKPVSFASPHSSENMGAIKDGVKMSASRLNGSSLEL